MAVTADYQVQFPENDDIYSILAAEGIEFLLSHSGEVPVILSVLYTLSDFSILRNFLLNDKLTSIRYHWNIFTGKRSVSSSLQTGAGHARTSLQSW